MNIRATHLKIKIHTLADEARHIRREERKALKRARHGKAVLEFHGDLIDYQADYRVYEGLHDHRTGVVRGAARINLLAYGFLRGHSYAEMEQKTRSTLDLVAVYRIVKRFGTTEDLARWPAWQTSAVQHLDDQAWYDVELPSSREMGEVA